MWRSTVIGLLVLTTAAIGQEGDDETLLAGPRVERQAKPTSLVVRSYDGTVTQLDVPAAEAAVELLELDIQAASAVDRILAERAAILDKAVIENVDLLIELQSTRGNQQRRREIYRELYAAAAPLTQRGSLRDEIAGVLETEQKTSYLEIIDEYEQAMTEQARLAADEEGRQFAARQFQRRQAVAEFGREIKRSYDRQIGSREKELEDLLVALALDQQTEAEVRRLIIEHAQRTLLNPDEADRAALMRQILAELTPEQRREAIRILRERVGMSGDG